MLMKEKRSFWKELLEKIIIALIIEILKQIFCHFFG